MRTRMSLQDLEDVAALVEDREDSGKVKQEPILKAWIRYSKLYPRGPAPLNRVIECLVSVNSLAVKHGPDAVKLWLFHPSDKSRVIPLSLDRRLNDRYGRGATRPEDLIGNGKLLRERIEITYLRLSFWSDSDYLTQRE